MVRNGWLYTGDIGYIDEEGYLVIKDRKKDLIIVSGFNVFPREIEDVIAECPGVADVCVIGIPHPRRGECPAAFVQPKVGADLTEAALEAWCEEIVERARRAREGTIQHHGHHHH